MSERTSYPMTPTEQDLHNAVWAREERRRKDQRRQLRAIAAAVAASIFGALVVGGVIAVLTR